MQKLAQTALAKSSLVGKLLSFLAPATALKLAALALVAFGVC